MKTLRMGLFSLHRWIGLHVAAYFLLIFLSGTLLVYTPEVEAIGQPGAWTLKDVGEAPISFGQRHDAIVQQVPGVLVLGLQARPKPWLGDRTFVIMADGRRASLWTDPADGTVLATTPDWNIGRLLRAFHDSLLVPRNIVHIAVTAMSLVLLGSVITGLVSYRRFWRGYLRRPASPPGSRQRAGEVHRLVAVWAAPFLLVSALTGLVFFLGAVGINGYKPSLPATEPRAQAQPVGFGAASIDAAVAAAVATQPGLVVKHVGLPGLPTQPITVDGHVPGEPAFSAETVIAIDPVDGQVLGVARPELRRGIARYRPLSDALHFGDWGGEATRAIWALFGLAASYLAFSGLRVSVRRLAPTPAPGQSGLSVLIGALGYWKWFYAVAIVGVTAAAVLRFVI